VSRRPKGFEALRDPLSRRTVWRTRARCGMELWVAPMPGFAAHYAALTTRFGSMDTHLPDGTRLPIGTAHFLEHKMFQTEEGDLFDVYASRGASANAYTTFSHTCYLFASTTRFAENLDTLLGSLADLTTDEAAVEREKGIIGQEIAMYDDDPAWRGWFALLGALYGRHPLRHDIAGTTQTIRAIRPPLLDRVFRTGYAPGNLVLTVGGDVDPDEVADRVDAAFGTRRRGKPRTLAPDREPPKVRRESVRCRLSVSRPWAWLGMKDRPPPRGGLARARRQVETDLVLDALFGDGGDVEAPLYAEGIVDDSLSAAYEAETGAAFAAVQAEVDDASAWRRRLEAELARVAERGLGARSLERARRRLLGRHLRTFDAPDRMAHWMQGLALEGLTPAEVAPLLRTADLRRANRRLAELLRAPRAWSVVLPLPAGRRRAS
jgi:predicted Zn-dependent peptidase